MVESRPQLPSQRLRKVNHQGDALRLGIPAIHLPGGTQLNAPDYVTSNKMWAMGAAVERGELPRQDLESAPRGACPTCGACQFMGSASTGQVLAEALGLALPGSALVPAPLTKLLRYARATGKQLATMIHQDLTHGATSIARLTRSRRYSQSDAASGSRRSHATTAGSSPCTPGSPATHLQEPLSPR
jgi:hypothetical protein